MEPEHRRMNIADVYFKRNRIDKLLAHVREAKTFGGKPIDMSVRSQRKIKA